MLLKINFLDRNKSIYKYDMCNKEIGIKELNKIKVERYCKNTKKYWDLCDECLEKLVKSINVYRKKKGGK